VLCSTFNQNIFLTQQSLSLFRFNPADIVRVSNVLNVEGGAGHVLVQGGHDNMRRTRGKTGIGGGGCVESLRRMGAADARDLSRGICQLHKNSTGHGTLRRESLRIPFHKRGEVGGRDPLHPRSGIAVVRWCASDSRRVLRGAPGAHKAPHKPASRSLW